MKDLHAALLGLLLFPGLVRAQVVAPTAVRSVPVSLALPVAGALHSPAAPAAYSPAAAVLPGLALPSAAAPVPGAAAPAAIAGPSIAAPFARTAAAPTAKSASFVHAQTARAAAPALAQTPGQTVPLAQPLSLRETLSTLAPEKDGKRSQGEPSARSSAYFDGARKPGPGSSEVLGSGASFARHSPGLRSAQLERRAEPADDAVSWEQIEKVVVFASPEQAERFERARGLEGVFRPHRPGEAAGWQSFLRAAFDLMQTAPEGREVLRQLLQEYGRTGKKVSIMPEDFADSTLIHDGGMEDINGTHGMVVPDQNAYYFNSKYLEFADRDLALQYVAANIAHEFRHLVNQAQVERISPEAAEAFGMALLNEQRARQTGYLVAVRTNKGKATGSTQEARSLVQDPDGYWEGLKMGGYAHFLDMAEMADPVAAFRGRIAALQEEAAGLRDQIENALPRALMALEILATMEGRGDEIKELREEVSMMASIFPEELKEIAETIAELSRMLKMLQSPRARGDLQYLRLASRAPAFRQLIADYARDLKALAQLLREKPVPAPKLPSGQLGWEKVRELVKESQKAHPEYWTGFWAKFGKEK